MEENNLKPKQKRFCEEYVACGIAQEAARRVGYAENTARIKAHKWLAKDSFKNYIAELNNKVSSEKIASAQEIQEILTQMARGQMNEECVASESIGGGGFQPTIVEKAITPKDRQKAAETLAKIKGMFSETPAPPVTINIQPTYEE